MLKVNGQTKFNQIVIVTSKRKSKSNFWSTKDEDVIFNTNYAFSKNLYHAFRVFASILIFSIISDLSDLFAHIKLVIPSYLSSRKKEPTDKLHNSFIRTIGLDTNSPFCWYMNSDSGYTQCGFFHGDCLGPKRKSFTDRNILDDSY